MLSSWLREDSLRWLDWFAWKYFLVLFRQISHTLQTCMPLCKRMGCIRRLHPCIEWASALHLPRMLWVCSPHSKEWSLSPLLQPMSCNNCSGLDTSSSQRNVQKWFLREHYDLFRTVENRCRWLPCLPIPNFWISILCKVIVMHHINLMLKLCLVWYRHHTRWDVAI